MIIKLAITAEDVNSRHYRRLMGSHQRMPNASSEFLEHSLLRNKTIPIGRKEITETFAPIVKRYNKHKAYVIGKKVLGKVKMFGLPAVGATGAYFGAKALFEGKDNKRDKY
jgi:hypothetical protein